MSNPFNNNDSCNAVWDAIHACGTDMFGCNAGDCDESEMVYNWLENTPRTSLCVEIVDKLRELGYEITKQKEDER